MPLIQFNVYFRAYLCILIILSSIPMCSVSMEAPYAVYKYASGTDLRPCTKFLPDPFSSFGRGQTDRQTDRQTNGLFNIPHYHVGDKNSTQWHDYDGHHTKDAMTPISQDLTRRRLYAPPTPSTTRYREHWPSLAREHSVSPDHPRAWNSLSESLRRTDCTQTFKRRLKTHFLTSTSALFCFNFSPFYWLL